MKRNLREAWCKLARARARGKWMAMLRLGRTRSQAALHCSFDRRDSRRIRRDRPSVGQQQQQQQRMARLRGEGGESTETRERQSDRTEIAERRLRVCMRLQLRSVSICSSFARNSARLHPTPCWLLPLALLAAHAFLPPKMGSSTRDSRCHPANQRRSDCAGVPLPHQSHLLRTGHTGLLAQCLSFRSTFAGALGQ